MRVFGLDGAVYFLVVSCCTDVEKLVDEMVDAFRFVLIVLPRGPTDDENYSRFIERTRTCSYRRPFCAPKPPFENMKVPASRPSRRFRLVEHTHQKHTLKWRKVSK